LKKTITKKRANGVAQGVSSEFKPQYHKRKKKIGMGKAVTLFHYYLKIYSILETEQTFVKILQLYHIKKPFNWVI
jgi:hypothetical protein